MESMLEKMITTSDGYAIAARFFLPRQTPLGSVLVAPAMGVPQVHYEPFARWLAEQGFLAGTFDYRGTGRSAPTSLRGFKADIIDWGQLDAQAMVDQLTTCSPGSPLVWVGHSVGGQVLPFVKRREKINKMITIACGSGYWRENSPPLKRRVWLLWYFVAPVALPLCGYFPGRRLKMVGDLPAPMMAQWRRWCLHPEYATGVEPGAREKFADVSTPIVSLSFTDDEFMSARNVESLHGFYRNAPRTMVKVAPNNEGLHRIGHFGFFRPENEKQLWQRYLLPELQKD